MAQDLSGLYISQSFQNLVQRSASGAFNVLATATGTEFVPVSASYAISASNAVNADNVISSSYAVSSSHAVNADVAISSSHAVNSDSAISSSHALNADNAVSSSYALTASYATNAAPPFPYTGSAEITGSLGVTGSMVVTRNEVGVNSTLIIKDEAQNSYNDGPTLQFSGSNVGLIKSAPATNMKIVAERDFELNVGQGGTGAQFNITLQDHPAGQFIINDLGKGSSRYIHDNLNESGSISFANPALDAGIAIRIDDNRMALEMRSGSISVPIIERKVATREINVYDSTFSTGSSGQVLSSNAQGGIEWAAGGGGGSAFPFTGSAKITGSLEVTGPTNFIGGVVQNGTGFSTYFGLNSGTAALVPPVSNKFSTGFGVGTLRDATGTENAAFGGDTLQFNTGGSRNAAYGQAGLKQNLTGGNNSSLGWNTLSNITSGDRNTAIGAEAGRVIVGSADNTNSIQSVFIGANTKPLNVGDTNTIVIGYTAEGQGSNTVVLGNTSITDTQLRGNVASTGRLSITGSANIGGGNHTIGGGNNLAVGSSNTNNSQGGIVVGNSNSVSGETAVVLGGEQVSVNSGYSGTLAGASNGITNADTSVILGGYQNNLQGTRTFIVAGNANTVNNGTDFSGIIGGQSNTIATNITASAVIGGKSITADKNETVFVPELEIDTVGGGITMYSPNGTEYKLTVSNAGALVIT